jgi:hypothetical protein
VTPHLVSLARKLEGRPFHIVASHCQRNSKEEVVAYIQGQGVEPDASNFTVTSFGRHPHIKGNGYVPYYAVFDHRGRLIRDHMCGDYHGGDGLRFIEVVEEALARTPSIYLGEDPFEDLAAVAADIEQGHKVGAHVTELEELVADDTEPEPRRAEGERLLQAIRDHVDRHLQIVTELEATDPAEVLPLLATLARQLQGRSQLGDRVEQAHRERKSSRELRRAVKMAASFDRVRTTLAELDTCDGCRRGGAGAFRPTCAACRQANERQVAAARRTLQTLLRRNEGLAFRRTVEAYLETLASP